MIRFTRLLTFEQYTGATTAAMLNTTFGRRFNYIARIRVLPSLSTLGLPLSLWRMVRTWSAPGDHAIAFAGWTVLCYLSVIFPLSIPLWHRKLRKLYKQQQMNLPWTIEVSEQGIRNTMPGKIETRFEWAFSRPPGPPSSPSPKTNSQRSRPRSCRLCSRPTCLETQATRHDRRTG